MTGTNRIYAASVWREDIIGAPAMVMALGIFLMYPGRFLIESVMDGEYGERLLLALTLLVCAFGGYVVFRFVAQAVTDRTVLWDFTLDHIRIGTWVAGLNVLASLVSGLEVHVARVLHGVGWIAWILYVFWLIQMTWKGKFAGKGLTGSLFLTTVATQSVVAGSFACGPITYRNGSTF